MEFSGVTGELIKWLLALVSTLLYLFSSHVCFPYLSVFGIRSLNYPSESMSAEGQELWSSPTALMCFLCYERLQAKADAQKVKKKRKKGKKSSRSRKKQKKKEKNQTKMTNLLIAVRRQQSRLLLMIQKQILTRMLRC